MASPWPRIPPTGYSLNWKTFPFAFGAVVLFPAFIYSTIVYERVRSNPITSFACLPELTSSLPHPSPSPRPPSGLVLRQQHRGGWDKNLGGDKETFPHAMADRRVEHLKENYFINQYEIYDEPPIAVSTWKDD